MIAGKDADERRSRVLRSGTVQVLWALMLVHIILLGVALRFGRDVGYGMAFGVCGGISVLVTVSFFSIHLLDRWTARLERRRARRE